MIAAMQSPFVALEIYAPFTANVTRHLEREGLVPQNVSVGAIQNWLLNTRDAMNALTRPDERWDESLARFHAHATVNLEARQIPPLLTEAAGALSHRDLFETFLHRFLGHAGRSWSKTEGAEESPSDALLCSFLKRFAPYAPSLGDYGKLAGKETEFVCDFYLILSASALYDPGYTPEEQRLYDIIRRLGTGERHHYLDVSEDIHYVIRSTAEGVHDATRRRGLIAALADQAKKQAAAYGPFGTYLLLYLADAILDHHVLGVEDSRSSVEAVILGALEIHTADCPVAQRCDANRDAARICIELGKIPQAKEYLKRAAELATDLSVRRELSKVWQEIANGNPTRT